MVLSRGVILYSHLLQILSSLGIGAHHNSRSIPSSRIRKVFREIDFSEPVREETGTFSLEMRTELESLSFSVGELCVINTDTLPNYAKEIVRFDDQFFEGLSLNNTMTISDFCRITSTPTEYCRDILNENILYDERGVRNEERWGRTLTRVPLPILSHWDKRDEVNYLGSKLLRYRDAPLRKRKEKEKLYHTIFFIDGKERRYYYGAW